MIFEHQSPRSGQAKNKNVLLAIFALLLIAGISYLAWSKTSDSRHPSPEASDGQGIRGTVLLGPTCPVVMDPPDPQCADKPYKTSLVVTTVDGARVIKQFNSDDSGKFDVKIEPGEYVVRSAAAANILPYCASNGTVKVNANSYTEITVNCDTGIR